MVTWQHRQTSSQLRCARHIDRLTTSNSQQKTVSNARGACPFASQLSVISYQSKSVQTFFGGGVPEYPYEGHIMDPLQDDSVSILC